MAKRNDLDTRRPNVSISGRRAAASTAAALVLFLFVRSFGPFVAVASLYCAGQCGLTAARQALLAGLNMVRQLHIPLITLGIHCG